MGSLFIYFLPRCWLIEFLEVEQWWWLVAVEGSTWCSLLRDLSRSYVLQWLTNKTETAVIYKFKQTVHSKMQFKQTTHIKIADSWKVIVCTYSAIVNDLIKCKQKNKSKVLIYVLPSFRDSCAKFNCLRTKIKSKSHERIFNLVMYISFCANIPKQTNIMMLKFDPISK